MMMTMMMIADHVDVICVVKSLFPRARCITEANHEWSELIHVGCCVLCRVDALYSFFIQWSPNVTGDGEVNVNDRGFVVLGSADSGAPATDGSELPRTNHPGRKWHVRCCSRLFHWSSLNTWLMMLLSLVCQPTVHVNKQLSCLRETAQRSELFGYICIQLFYTLLIRH